jgi:hypothetical protein
VGPDYQHEVLWAFEGWDGGGTTDGTPEHGPRERISGKEADNTGSAWEQNSYDVAQFGRHLKFSGVPNDFSNGVEWSNVPIPWATEGNITVEILVWLDSTNGEKTLNLFNAGLTGGSGRVFLFLWDAATQSRTLWAQTRSTTAYQLAAYPEFPVDRWVHIAVEQPGDPTKASKLYIDGVKVADSSIGGATVAAPTGVVNIGSPATTANFNGKVSHIRVYRGLIGGKAIADLYADPFGPIRYDNANARRQFFSQADPLEAHHAPAKPSPWNVDPALVAPEWSWYHDTVGAASLLWPGAHLYARGEAHPPSTNLMTLDHGPHGDGYLSDTATERIVWTDNDDTLGIGTRTGKGFSVLFSLRYDGQTLGNPAFITRRDLGLGAGVWEVYLTGNHLRWFAGASFETVSWDDAFADVVAGDMVTICVTHDGATTARAYLNGTDLGTQSTTFNPTTSAGGIDLALGVLGEATTNTIFGLWECFHIFPETMLSGSQVAQLTADPFGPFRHHRDTSALARQFFPQDVLSTLVGSDPVKQTSSWNFDAAHVAPEFRQIAERAQIIVPFFEGGRAGGLGPHAYGQLGVDPTIEGVTDPGWRGAAMNFNGSDQSLGLANDYSYTTEPFSMLMRFRTTSTDNSDILAGAGWTGGTSPLAIWQNQNDLAGSGLKFALRGNTTAYITKATSSILHRDGNWHTAIVTYDGSGNIDGLNAYLDHIRLTTEDDSGPPLAFTQDTLRVAALERTSIDLYTDMTCSLFVVSHEEWSGQPECPQAVLHGGYSYGARQSVAR